MVPCFDANGERACDLYLRSRGGVHVPDRKVALWLLKKSDLQTGCMCHRVRNHFWGNAVYCINKWYNCASAVTTSIRASLFNGVCDDTSYREGINNDNRACYNFFYWGIYIMEVWCNGCYNKYIPLGWGRSRCFPTDSEVREPFRPAGGSLRTPLV